MKELLEKLNGQKKTILSAIAGGLIAAIPVAAGTAITIGSYKEKVDTIGETLKYHIESYTPPITAEFRTVQVKEAEHEVKIATLQKALDEIKLQNNDILRLLRKQAR